MNGYFDSIQAGIDASEDGDTVLVAPGEYPVNLVLDNRNITLASWFLTTGDREFIEQTILNGSSRSQVINLTGENNQSLLCGLTLRNGLAPERLQGSGIDIRDGASPILRALIISENQGGNGAIWCQGVQDVVWDDLRIINNSGGQYCSGLILWESVVTVNDALFLGNDGGLAGALYLTRPEECILTLNRCEFDGNSSNTSGVAEVQRGSTLNLNHCYAHDNIVRDERGDWIRSSESVVNANFCLFECTDDNETVAIRTRTAPQDQRIVNCTFVGFGGYAILCQEGGVQVINSVLWGNGIQQNGVQIDGDVDVTFSLVENMEREGILNEDPLFVNPGEGDYHLTENSPCIDTGDPDSDPDPDGTRADMGAYYFHQDVAPEGFNYAGTFESHDYFLSENTTRWLNARDACENAGGYLVCIGSEEENVFIHQIVENFEIESGLLIGFNDLEEEDSWLWVNGEETIYTNWTDGAPNNDGGEDYGRMEFPNGEWQDVRNAVTHFVLEIPDDRVLNVPDDYETIQAAINASEDGDTVLVAAGRYFENIDFSGKNISVIGNPDNPEEVMIDGSENGSVVTFANEETETAIISGFTIRNGSARFGGGIYCHNSNPQLIDVIISGNTAIDNGGGIYCLDNSSPTLTNVNISNNTAAKGGGIFMYYESCPALTSVSIKGNIASNQGGGIFCNDGCDAVLTHVTISGNAAENGGGGLVLHERSEPVIINSIFWDNEPQECYFTENGNPNILTISYSDFEGGQDGIITNNNGEVGWREGNINADPMFVDPENGDFNLSGDSPCIDTGTAFFVFEEDTLLDISEDNYIGDAPDMGTMEYDPADVREKEGNLPSSFILYPCYPNPFNSTTTIKYNLPFASQVRLNLYNLSGQRIETLVNRRLQAGVHRTQMYAGDLASGLYFVRLEAGGLINIQKVMLVK
ncbi:MAG: T9SS type A sorting domain-containing protein [Calditrichaeota bacterium]|nr:T9SS type A sorting domain-containing protein [Calditrichota bacterium]